MYEVLLGIHSIMRWLVLLTAGVALVTNISGWRATKTWTPKNRKINAAFIGSLHLQVVLGLILYVGGISPTMVRIFNDFGGAMKLPELRFWAVEHIAGMVLAAIVAHVAHVMAKNHDADRARFKYASIGFMLSVVLIVASIPWPFRELIGRSLLPSF